MNILPYEVTAIEIGMETFSVSFLSSELVLIDINSFPPPSCIILVALL